MKKLCKKLGSLLVYLWFAAVTGGFFYVVIYNLYILYGLKNIIAYGGFACFIVLLIYIITREYNEMGDELDLRSCSSSVIIGPIKAIKGTGLLKNERKKPPCATFFGRLNGKSIEKVGDLEEIYLNSYELAYWKEQKAKSIEYTSSMSDEIAKSVINDFISHTKPAKLDKIH